MVRALIFVFAALTLCGCATARMHSEAELNVAAQGCGLALGELVQEQDAKKLLFLFRIAPSLEQRRCVQRWARENHLRPVIIEAINEPQA